MINVALDETTSVADVDAIVRVFAKGHRRGRACTGRRMAWC